MDYLDIGSFLPDWPEWLEFPDLPDLPPAIQSAWQVCWEQLQLVDGLYLAVAGECMSYVAVKIILLPH